jgi:RNA polymerase sigma-70 factor (ECF subfamily)
VKNVLVATTRAPATSKAQALTDDFDTIVREHQKRIYRILFFLLRDQDEADALTQECFLRAYSRRASFRGDAKPGTWLVRIAINLAQDQLRSRRRRFWQRLLRGKRTEVGDLADSRVSPEQEFLDRERVGAVWAAVESLPVRQRAIFTLRFAEEMPLGEIAETMSLREGTVKAHLSSAIKAVKRELCRRAEFE